MFYVLHMRSSRRPGKEWKRTFDGAWHKHVSRSLAQQLMDVGEATYRRSGRLMNGAVTRTYDLRAPFDCLILKKYR